MKKLIISIIVIGHSMLVVYGGQKFTSLISISSFETFQHKKDSAKTEYKIEDKAVSKEKFDARLAELNEINSTWFCAETSTGGITGYDAKDKKGKVFEVRFYYDDGNSKSSITSKNIK